MLVFLQIFVFWSHLSILNSILFGVSYNIIMHKKQSFECYYSVGMTRETITKIWLFGLYADSFFFPFLSFFKNKIQTDSQINQQTLTNRRISKTFFCLCSLLIIIGHFSNNKMRYNADFQAMERSRSLENGVLHNERRY